MPHGLRLAAAWTWRVIILGLGATVIGWLIAHFAQITIPFLIALLIAALLAPAHRTLVNAKVPRALATAATVLLALATVLGGLVFIGSRIASGLEGLIVEVAGALTRIQDWLITGPLGLETQQIQRLVADLQQELLRNRDSVVNSALTLTTTAGSAAAGLVLTLFILIFLLHDGQRIWRWMVSLMPSAARSAVNTAGLQGWGTLTSYVRAIVVVAAVDAAGIGAAAVVLQLPLAVPIFLLVFLSAFVPIVGAILSGAVAILVALVTQGLTAAVIMLLVVLAVQQLEGNVLQPLLMGRAVSLHPLGVVLSVTAGVIVAGVVGAVFAVPAVAILRAVVGSLRDSRQADPASAAAA